MGYYGEKRWQQNWGMLQKTAIKEILTSNGGPVKTCDFHHNWPTNWPFGRTILFSHCEVANWIPPCVGSIHELGTQSNEKQSWDYFDLQDLTNKQAAAVTNQTCNGNIVKQPWAYTTILVCQQERKTTKSHQGDFSACLLTGGRRRSAQHVHFHVHFPCKNWRTGRQRMNMSQATRRPPFHPFLPVRFRKVTWGWVSDEML